MDLPTGKTPKSGSTLSWGVANPSSFKSGGQFTTAMKVYVPWWKRRTFWLLVGLVAFFVLVQIDIDTGGSLYDMGVAMFNWLRTQPWLTLLVGGAIGYFVRDRAVQLVSRHDILPDVEKK